MRCGGELEVRFPRSFSCRSCGFEAYFNPKPVACVIPVADDGSVVLIRRSNEPGRGLWTMPGGFVELGETIEDAARREAEEEIGVPVVLDRLLNVYSRPDEQVLMVMYVGRPLGTPVASDEALEVRAFAPGDVPWDELAFWSTELALRELAA